MFHTISTFAQEYTYYTYTDTAADGSDMGILLTLYVAGVIVFGIPAIVGLWKMFQKAGYPGWAAIVPVYNFIIYLKMVGRPTWWLALILLTLIPFAGVVVAIVLGIILANDMAKSFGKDASYTVLLFLVPFIGYPMLGFGKAEYKGPVALGAPTKAPHEHPHRRAG
jgi:ABC-type sugar transport system permease subunit